MLSLKLSTSNRYSLLTAIIVIVVFSAFYLISNLMVYDDVNWTVFTIINVVLFLSSYFLSKLILDRFIYDKIKLVYKTIHDLKYPKQERKAKMFQEKDVIKQANQEVLQWANEKKVEIAELKKLEAYRREFLGNVSRELKTPVLDIQGCIMTLLEGGIDDPKINSKYLKNAEKSIDRLTSIIDDLEVISRLESGEMQLDYSTFDIIKLAKEVMEFMDIKAQKININLHFGKNYDKPMLVNADREQIQQVFINLINNAIKYSDEKGICKISFFDMDENILVEVTDRGKGIPKKELPRVFERFYRGEFSRSRKHEDDKGTGLGLSIVKHVIEAHNQTINVRSTPEVGTTFAFTLKRVKDKE